MEQKIKENRLLNIFKHFRRIFYSKFRKEYIRKSLAKRKGSCKMCGCCGTNFKICEHYIPETKECRLVKEGKYPDSFPLLCRIYPFDEFDKTAYSKANCGFYWDDKK